MKKSVCMLVALLWGVIPILAQTPELQKREWDGPLQGHTPEIITQDRRGMTYIGSSEGLFLFDGEQLSPAKWRDTALQVHPPHIRSFYQDPEGTYWVGSQSGRIYRSKNIDRGLHLWTPEEGLPKAAVIDFETDTLGQLWFATAGEGLYVYNGRRIYNFNEFDGLPGVDVNDMISDETGCVWAATDAGLVRCQLSNGEKDIQVIGVDQGLPDEIVTTLCKASPGKLWLGTHQQGVYSYDYQTKKFKAVAPSLAGDPIKTLATDDHSLWIGSEHAGLSVYNDNGLQRIKSGGTTIDRISDLMVGVEKNLWVLSETTSWWIGNLWFRFLKTPFRNVQAVHAAKNGSLWLGTQKGLYHAVRKDTSWNYENIRGIDGNVISLYRDPYGVLWIGTFGKGVFCYDPASRRIRHLRKGDGLINESILSMDGRNDSLWLATLGGVMEVHLRENILNGEKLLHSDYTHKNQLGTNYIYQVLAGQNGHCYFATDGKGVALLDKGTIEWISETDSAGRSSVYSMATDSNGTLWFSTQKGQVYYCEDQTQQPMALQENRYQREISSIIHDGHGRLLISYPEGIDLVDTKSRSVRTYDEDVGMESFNPFLNSYSKGPGGNIWLGHENGLVRYEPFQKSETTAPRIILTETALYLEPVEMELKTEFNHDENHFTFEFLGLWYTDPEQLTYRYTLEGYDLNWKESQDRQALYSNLSPGNYTFKVQVSQNGRFEHAPTASYSFTIAKPIWTTWWFITAVIIFGGLMIYWLVKTREYRLKREENLKRETVASQFETLKSQINPHFLFNSFNTLISVIEEESEIAVQYVEKLSDFYRSILQYREKDLIPLEEELQLIKDYKYLLNMRYQDRLNIELPDDSSNNAMIAPLTLQILMENAIKHNVISKRKPLDIEVSLNGDQYVTITNKLQKKLSGGRSTGFGLESIVNRYRVLTDRPVKISSQNGLFTVKIPVIKPDKK